MLGGQTEAAAIAKDGSVTLPVSWKVGMVDIARGCLVEICGEYGANMDGVLYAFDNEWQEEHYFMLLLLRYGAAALLWFVLAVRADPYRE